MIFSNLLLPLLILSLACSLTRTPPPTEDNAVLQTFTDSLICYAFDYPQGWVLFGEAGQGVSILNFATPGGGIQEGQIKLDFIPRIASSLDQLAVGSHAGDDDFSNAPRITLPSGLEAIRTRIQDQFGAEVQILLTFINEAGLGVSGYGDSAAFDTIVSTLRPC